jgi:hypothetical protein
MVMAMTITADRLLPRSKLDYYVGCDAAVKGASVVVWPQWAGPPPSSCTSGGRWVKHRARHSRVHWRYSSATPRLAGAGARQHALPGGGDHRCASYLLCSPSVGMRQGVVPVEGKIDVGGVNDAMAGLGGNGERDRLHG